MSIERKLAETVMIVVGIDTKNSIITGYRRVIWIDAIISLLLLNASVLLWKRIQMIASWGDLYLIHWVIHLTVVGLLESSRRLVSLSERLFAGYTIIWDVFFLRVMVYLRVLKYIQKLTSCSVKLIENVIIEARLDLNVRDQSLTILGFMSEFTKCFI